MRNVFRIQRLKDKLGNRSNASAEIEFDGTVGLLVGEPGRGVRAIIDMVQRTRLDCVLGTAAGMRQSVAEAVWHARGRAAFGALLVDQPAMTAVLADLALEAEAAMLTGHAARARVRGRGIGPRRRLPPARDARVEVLGVQAGPAARLRGARVPRRQRLHRVVPARPALSGAAGDGGLGGLRQRHRARRAAGADARAGQRRGLRRGARRDPRRIRAPGRPRGACARG